MLGKKRWKGCRWITRRGIIKQGVQPPHHRTLRRLFQQLTLGAVRGAEALPLCPPLSMCRLLTQPGIRVLSVQIKNGTSAFHLIVLRCLPSESHKGSATASTARFCLFFFFLIIIFQTLKSRSSCCCCCFFPPALEVFFLPPTTQGRVLYLRRVRPRL